MQSSSRRRLLSNGLSLASAGVLGALLPRISFAADRIVVTDPGGATQQAYANSFYKPFEKETGIAVAYSARPNLAVGQLKSMVMTNNMEWDLTYLTDFLVQTAVKGDLLDTIDYSGMDKALLAQMLPGTVTPYSAGGVMYGTVLGYNTTIWKTSASAPSNWADFWDVKRFPGKRSMMGMGYGPMEEALLADGVPRDKIYPIDVPRALAKLDQIRPHIDVWTTSSAQQYQLLVNNEVDLLQGFANRITAAVADGAKTGIQWQDGRINLESWVIPKGAKNRPTVLKFIEYALDARRQANAFVGSGPTNGQAVGLLTPEQSIAIPTDPRNFPRMYRADAKWIAENQAALTAKWTEWRARQA